VLEIGGDIPLGEQRAGALDIECAVGDVVGGKARDLLTDRRVLILGQLSLGEEKIYRDC